MSLNNPYLSQQVPKHDPKVALLQAMGFANPEPSAEAYSAHIPPNRDAIKRLNIASGAGLDIVVASQFGMLRDVLLGGKLESDDQFRHRVLNDILAKKQLNVASGASLDILASSLTNQFRRVQQNGTFESDDQFRRRVLGSAAADRRAAYNTEAWKAYLIYTRGFGPHSKSPNRPRPRSSLLPSPSRYRALATNPAWRG